MSNIYSTIQAIRTEYKGILYRSKLEAQWAYYMDLIGVPYQYEYKKFQLVGRKYTPDFMINRKVYLEIKPEVITLDTIQKVSDLAVLHKLQVFLCSGDFYNGYEIMRADPTGNFTFDYDFVRCVRCNSLKLANTVVCPVCYYPTINYIDRWEDVKERFKSTT